jgi:DNA-binding beta-propeller fold protein YncE
MLQMARRALLADLANLQEHSQRLRRHNLAQTEDLQRPSRHKLRMADDGYWRATTLALTCVELWEAPMTTGPGDEKAAGGPGRGHLRASHADRERVIAALKAAFIQGRLAKDEFDSRVGRALGSRTYAELAALTADIPAGLTGPVARNALQADIKPRHRRRARRIAGSLAAIAVIVATISVASLSHRPAFVAAARPTGAIMYVAASNGMTPVAAATNTPGKPIKIGAIPAAIAITPDGRTAYIADVHPGTVTPVATATNTPGKPIKIGGFPWAIAITPDGRTAYIVDLPAYGRGRTTVIPVATATDTPGKPIKISDIVGLSAAIAITPDGKTAYVVSGAHMGTTVTPIATATNAPGKPIKIGGGSPRAAAIAITPDGKTAYVVSASVRRTTVTPVATATNTPGKPINIGGIGRITAETAIAITPDGKTAYIADGNHRTVIPVATATKAPGKPIKISGTPVAIAITPDGRTAYVATAAYIAGSCAGCAVGTVIPVATAANTPGKPIKIGRIPKGIAITP